MKEKLYFFICFSLFLSNGIFAQNIIRQSINPFGNSFSDSDISVNQTVGQSSIVGTSVLDDGKTIRQGFQQPVISTKAIYHSDIKLTISTYPNPFQETFFLKLDGDDITVLFNLSNAIGQVIFFSKINTNEEYSFSLPNLAPGIYFISIFNVSDKSRLITKKITKTI